MREDFHESWSQKIEAPGTLMNHEWLILTVLAISMKKLIYSGIAENPEETLVFSFPISGSFSGKLLAQEATTHKICICFYI